MWKVDESRGRDRACMRGKVCAVCRRDTCGERNSSFSDGSEAAGSGKDTRLHTTHALGPGHSCTERLLASEGKRSAPGVRGPKRNNQYVESFLVLTAPLHAKCCV